MATIELARRRGVAGLVMVVGLAMLVVSAGRVTRGDAPLGLVLFAGFNVLVVMASVRPLFARSPRFRATPEGCWFGGGKVIPWSEISAVYEAMTVAPRGGLPNRMFSIAIEFHRGATALAAPALHWYAFATKRIDVAPDVMGANMTRIAAQLEAWRCAAAGTQDLRS